MKKSNTHSSVSWYVRLMQDNLELDNVFDKKLVITTKKSRYGYSKTLLIRPSEESDLYTVTFEGSVKRRSIVWLHDASKYHGDIKEIPHIYSKYLDKERDWVPLCLYYPKWNELKPDSRFNNTIIPWTIEWLEYFDMWRIDHKWRGGGKH
ncbi:hypothetical protein ACEN4E_01900 [Latilactobacillus sakei]|uniref:hypothetical protein n=1 Tax=Latilactobacillus sakei TaxID=1599 RepID=UPI0038851BDD